MKVTKLQAIRPFVACYDCIMIIAIIDFLQKEDICNGDIVGWVNYVSWTEEEDSVVVVLALGASGILITHRRQLQKFCGITIRSFDHVQFERATMPPRIPVLQAARCCRASITAPSKSPLASLFAALSIQSRSASILASLSDNKGAYNKRIRKGRGPSSGYGKTSGRGHKGQKQHGKVKPWFQGGQTPLIFSHGKKGFVNQYVLPVS